jgi:hypothetical protein
MLKLNQNFSISTIFCSFTSVLLIHIKNQLPYELPCVISKMGTPDLTDNILRVRIPLSPQQKTRNKSFGFFYLLLSPQYPDN